MHAYTNKHTHTDTITVISQFNDVQRA